MTNRVDLSALVPDAPREWSPWRLVLIVGGSIFVVELLVMIVFERLASLTGWQHAVVSTGVLMVILLPVLYAFVHRPSAARTGTRRHLLESAIDAAADSIVITDRDGRIVEVNPAFTRLTGYAPEEVIGRTPALLKSGTHDETFYRDLWETITAGRVWQGEIVNRRKDGELYVEQQTIAPVRDADGAITHFIAIKQDVTAHRVAEERYRSLFEDSRDAVIVSDLDDRVIDTNRATLELLGYDSRSMLLDRVWSSHWHPEDRSAFGDELIRRGYVHNLEVRVTDRRGRIRELLASATAIRDAAGDLTGYQAILRDVTELREVEARLRDTQKLEAVGRLASGVAHDFNNLLTVINGYAEIGRNQVAGDHPLADPLDEIHETGRIAAALTRQLLALANGQVLHPETIDLRETVASCRRLLETAIGDDVTIEYRLGSDPIPILADPAEVEQVLLNLVINARDAQPEGGEIHVETASITDYRGRRATDRVSRLVVRDDGVGIPSTLHDRIFEPLFTTKAPGRGTGLGLSTVRDIVERRDGTIRVASRAGEGATFTIDFPRAAEPEEAPPEDHPRKPEPGGGERILVVDDDNTVRKMCADMLRGSGYRVRTAGRASEAVRLLDELDEPIDLVLVDVVLPGRGGFELAEELRSTQADLGVVYMSGYYVRGSVERSDRADPVSPILQKPFTRDQLLRGVRSGLETRPSEPTSS